MLSQKQYDGLFNVLIVLLEFLACRFWKAREATYLQMYVVHKYSHAMEESRENVCLMTM